MVKQPKLNIGKSFYVEQSNFAKDALYSTYTFITAKSGRQSGKSYCLDRIGIALALRESRVTIMWVTPSHDQSKDAMERIVQILLDSKIEFKPVYSTGDRYILFNCNNSKISFKSSERFDLLRGKHPDYLILDEFAYFKEGAWDKALAPYLIANRKMKVIAASTFNGKNNFYDFYMRGIDDRETSYISHSLHYSKNPNANLEYINEQRKRLPRQIFEQEYEGMAIFGSSVVFGDFSHCQTVTKWSEPVENVKYYFGIDWSGTGDDKTILTIMDDTGKIALIYEVNSTRTPEQVKELFPLIRKYNAVGYGESNGLGASGNQLLEDMKIQITDWVTTNGSKQDIVSQLIEDITNSEIALPELNLCPKLDSEMSSFVVDRTATGKLQYKHQVGQHDDYIDSVMLANKARIDNIGNYSVTGDVDYYDLY